MDKRDYIAEVVRRTGIRIDEDDPAFAVAVLAQLVLEKQSSQVAVDLEAAAKKVEQSLIALVERADSLRSQQTETAAVIEKAVKGLAETAARLKSAAADMAEAERAKAGNVERNSQALRQALAQGIKENLPPPSAPPAPLAEPQSQTSGWAKATTLFAGFVRASTGLFDLQGDVMIDSNVLNGTDSTVQVALTDGKLELFDKAVAEVKDGHLVVRNNILYNNTKVVAIYAPGAWLSASLPVSARQ